MRRRVATLRVLLDRKIADRLRQVIEGVKPAQIGQQVLNILAAMLTKPSSAISRLVKDGLLDRQVSVFRPNQKPVLFQLPCRDSEQRDAVRRLLMALACELAAQLSGPVIPDASTILKAVVMEWLDANSLDRRPDALRASRSAQAEPIQLPSRRTSLISAQFRRRRKKRRTKAVTPRLDPNDPHPNFPDVCRVPIAWRPNRRGRPPKDALRNGRGEWLPPPGWRVIRNRWHAPLTSCEPSKAEPRGRTGGESLAQLPLSAPPPPPVHAPPEPLVVAAGHPQAVPEGPSAPLSATPDGEAASGA